MEIIYIILLISAAAPVIGSLLGVLKRPSNIMMYNMLAFAAGVMLSISFLELIPESIEFSSIWLCCLGIIIGAAIMYAVDKLIPHFHPELASQEQGCHLKRTAVYLLLGIFLHNFPEGIAIAIGGFSSAKLSLTIAIAIAIHDIPEGICTSAPYYYCTKKRWKSFFLSSLTSIPTVGGFLLAHFLLRGLPFPVIGVIMAATAGLMIYIAGDELIPCSCNKNLKHWSHSTIFSLITGVVSVILLGLL
ncbi:ZIP family metal transporter [Candidatus Woesearchaeota archaeon]|nr:ZIP family metal transporter [Candidatus Woesearchaeota archaeon]